MKHVTWNEVDEFVNEVARRYENSGLIGVWGPPRGGLIFAVMLSHRLNIPMVMSPVQGCLIVDDIADTGETLNKYDKQGYIIATMFYHKHCSFVPNYWKYEKTDEWIEYPWELTEVEYINSNN